MTAREPRPDGFQLDCFTVTVLIIGFSFFLLLAYYMRQYFDFLF